MSIPLTKSSFRFTRHAALLLVGSLAASGCDCGGSDDTKPHGSPTGPGARSSGTGGMGQGGSGGMGTGGGDGTLTETNVVVNDATYSSPFDAALSKDASVVYFTAIGPDGPGVFSVPAAGGTILKL